MGSRNVLTLLIVIFVAVVLYNALYFTGIVGNFGADDSIQPLEQDPRFEQPGMTRPGPLPQASGTAPRPSATPAPTVAPRRALSAGDLTITSDWGRNPFLTPPEVWALANYRPVYVTEPSIPAGGLVVTAIVVDSSGRRVAVINDQIVGIGDIIGGMEVVEMWDDAVVFRLDGERHVLRMADQGIGLSVRGGPSGRY